MFFYNDISNSKNFFVIAGPCVIESESLTYDIAAKIKEITSCLGINFIFKASLDKANRTAISSFRGIGIDKGLSVLAKIKRELDIPVLTDVHDVISISKIATVVDVLQIPAFLSRQTDLLVAAANTGLTVNVKKGQFLSPYDMKNVLSKLLSTGNKKVMLTERGTMFGYNNMVVDMRSLEIMKSFSYPVIFDMTHSVQLPGAGGSKSSGQRQFIPTLAKAAVAVGISGLFLETHPNPDKALSDGPNSIPLSQLFNILSELKELDNHVKNNCKFSFPDKYITENV